MTRAAVLVALAALPLIPGVAANLRRRGPADSESLHNVQVEYCPLACEYAGSNPTSWTAYRSWDELSLCADTVLFTLNVQGGATDPTIRACRTTATGPQMHAGAYYGLINNNITETPTPELVAQIMAAADEPAVTARQIETCGATPKDAGIDLETNWSGEAASTPEQLAASTSQLEKYIRYQAACGSTAVFAKSGDSVVGVFAGNDLAKPAAADLLASGAKSAGSVMPGRYAMQACGVSGEKQPSLDTRFALFADLRGNVTAVRTFLSDYIQAYGQCIDVQGLEQKDHRPSTFATILTSSFTSSSNGTASNSTLPHNSTLNERSVGNLKARGTCRDIQVQSGNGCSALAQRCGISSNDFTKYNSNVKNLCSTLMPKQWVCCSEGDLPEHGPQPNADGSCVTTTIQEGVWCSTLADLYGVDVQHIEKVNQNTYGFVDCNILKKGQVICLSKGDPPMPAQDPNAVCGPWVVGTQRPSNYSNVGNLNPCPLNACCDVWGQCGTTDEFCTPSEIKGRPGTAESGTNGCVSNCGTDIVNNGSPPAKFARVGYFEAFNKNRPCLHMDITQFDTNTYTHVHFAFATISADFKVEMDKGVKEQFDKMVAWDSKGVKKILSFGGWAFSTEPATSARFAQAMSPANRDAFANTVVQFLKDNKLDGLDFDWEYPGATDIKGAAPGSPSDGLNYLKFLTTVKGKLPSGSTLSIALPASYWYLRTFPIDKMAKVVDYFIYMTYDLHGQWDYDSKWAIPGCPSGRCLRSHVNMTETKTALSMVTKAGAKTNQIMMGVSSYARSFKMKDPSCDTGDCEFVGSYDHSEAEKGKCTGESGYIADAELESLIYGYELEDDSSLKRWYSDSSESDIITWRGNWAAYMGKTIKDKRIKWAAGRNFAGTTDWAVDLQTFRDPVKGDTSQGELVERTVVTCDLEFADLDALSQAAGNHFIPSPCKAIYLLRALYTLLDSTIKQYNDVSNNYEGKFKYYAEYINDLVNPQLDNWMDNWKTDQDTKQGLGNRFFDCKYKRTDKGKYLYEGPCPVPKDIMSNGTWDDPEDGYESWIIEYTLANKTGFEEALSTELGMQPDWIKWEEWHDSYPECEGAEDDCNEVHWWRGNFPRKADKITVQDPKEIWDKALPEMGKLRDRFSAALLAVGLGAYNPVYDNVDAALALAMPVQMLAQAAQHMADVKEIGSKIEARKKKELILLIVSVVLMVIPFVGEAGAALAGFATLARFAWIGGEIANGALSIYEAIDDPESAPLAVVGMLLGAAGRTKPSEEVFADASSARRAMKDVHVSGMGKTYKAIDDKIQNTIKSCGRL